VEENLRSRFDDLEVNVQLVVEDIDFINSNLAEGQFFFTDIKREGKILYTSGKYGLTDQQGLSPTRRREIAEEDFKKWFDDAEMAFQGAGFFASKKGFGWAAFAFQQTAELCYKAVEQVFTLYQPHEHDLWILRRRAGKLDRRILDALPCDTDKQADLFSYLSYAYIGGRYQSEEAYPVTREQLDYWAVETKRLLEITDTVCRERIEALRAIERGG
jgi:HEPN domain-containing protein